MSIRGKSTNALMKHIRDVHKVNIGGTKEKKELLKMGYFHGYKAYRFGLENYITDFYQVEAIYEFDMELKSFLYEYTISFETLVKNVTLSLLVSSDNGGTSLPIIFTNKLTSYQKFTNQDRKSKELRKRLALKSNLEKEVMFKYGKERYVSHFVDSQKPLPIWAYFELMTLGTFGSFVSLLDDDTKVEVSKSLKTYDNQNDPHGTFLEKDIFLIKELRNSIAHNGIIFDTRFKSSNRTSGRARQLKLEFSLNNDLRFNSIIDYALLLLHYSNAFMNNNTDSKKALKNLSKLCNKFKNNLNNQSILFKILGSDYEIKLKNSIDSL